jgi:hypothetical protein
LIWVILMQWKIRNLHRDFKCHIQPLMKWNWDTTNYKTMY